MSGGEFCYYGLMINGPCLTYAEEGKPVKVLCGGLGKLLGQTQLHAGGTEVSYVTRRVDNLACGVGGKV